ncbi:hypothetical protein FB45DRAFT_939040 [Roridomyces roridus]|uniref:C2H2-type domain-containing protein n=1 Tax=Roridomyces roridus TaxID=1738132 RepID=A0AAD7B7P5_9AGAR|nr:hypothetical protein FB45DRAFT_939040 [Roridomyces roridus]
MHSTTHGLGVVKDLLIRLQKTYDCNTCGLSFSSSDDLRWHTRRKECDEDDVDNFHRHRQEQAHLLRSRRDSDASTESDESGHSLHHLLPSQGRVDAVVNQIRRWAPSTSDDSDGEHSFFPTHASARIGAVVDRIRHRGDFEPALPPAMRKYSVGTRHPVPPPFTPREPVLASSKAAPPLPPRPQSNVQSKYPLASSSHAVPPPLPPRHQSDAVARPRASTTPSRRAPPPIPPRHSDAAGRLRASTMPSHCSSPLAPRPQADVATSSGHHAWYEQTPRSRLPPRAEADAALEKIHSRRPAGMELSLPAWSPPWGDWANEYPRPRLPSREQVAALRKWRHRPREEVIAFMASEAEAGRSAA